MLFHNSELGLISVLKDCYADCLKRGSAHGGDS